MTLSQHLVAHGKLLLTGEYLVLHGAKSLAMPVSMGQTMTISSGKPGILEWQANDAEGEWFSGSYILPQMRPLAVSDEMVSNRLIDLLQAARSLNPEFLNGNAGYRIVTKMDFNRHWGFGSSSSLIALVSEFSGTDPFRLHNLVSNGSGYDVACAFANHPILFSRNGSEVSYHEISFVPEFAGSLYFVYLGYKQNSTREVTSFLKRNPAAFEPAINEISELTNQIAAAENLDIFNNLILKHEQLMSEVLNLPTVGEKYFYDFQGVVKSLGAWGGDFILASSDAGDKRIFDYFRNKGCTTIFKYKDLIINA